MFDAEKFMNLLFATHNIAPFVEPGDQEGQDATDSALDVGYKMSELAAKSPAHAAGVLVVAKLLVEVMASDNPNEYMETEAERAFNGNRHCFQRATINVLTR